MIKDKWGIYSYYGAKIECGSTFPIKYIGEIRTNSLTKEYRYSGETKDNASTK